jgi:ribosomal protein S3
VIKIFAKQRSDITGLCLKFKGRVNKWRRTKAIIGQTGLVLANACDQRIEYGTAKVVTRKGTLGIRVWIAYNMFFKTKLREGFLEYFFYVKNLRLFSLKRFYYNFILQ